MDATQDKLANFIKENSKPVPSAHQSKVERIGRFLWPERFVVYDNETVFIVEKTSYVKTNIETVRKLVAPESQSPTSISNILEEMRWPSVGYSVLKEGGFDSVEEFATAFSN